MLYWTEGLKDGVVRQAEAGYPEEICGVLVGRWSGEEKIVSRLVPIENRWQESGEAEFSGVGDDFGGASRHHRFKISPEDYYRVDIDARTAGEAILGFYHSHPDHPARPSDYDLRLAREIFPGFSYMIVSVQRGKATDVTSWVLRDDYADFDPEPLRFAPLEL
ncbi:MAG: M67 family metallopeptidase [Capsulimonadales bacterium]|nr:M67 family metallopeptidase [Capsulimonadales bacterium]